MSIDLEQVHDFLSAGGLISLATVDDEQPRVRVVSIIPDGQEYYFISFKERDKMSQLEENDRFEFFFGIKIGERWGSIRASGKAVIVDEEERKKKIVDIVPFFNDSLESIEDPEYALVRLDVEEFRVQDPEDGKQHRFVVKR